jgi:hypothetical protein
MNYLVIMMFFIMLSKDVIQRIESIISTCVIEYVVMLFATLVDKDAIEAKFEKEWLGNKRSDHFTSGTTGRNTYDNTH